MFTSVILLLLISLQLTKKVDHFGITHFFSHLDASFEDVGRGIMIGVMTDPSAMSAFFAGDKLSKQQKFKLISQKVIDIINKNQDYPKALAKKTFQNTTAINEEQKLKLFKSALNQPQLFDIVKNQKMNQQQRAKSVIELMKKKQPQIMNKLLQDQQFIKGAMQKSKTGDFGKLKFKL